MRQPLQPSGRGSDLLGPSDNSDSGSDALGTSEIHGDSDAWGTGERGAVSGTDAKDLLAAVGLEPGAPRGGVGGQDR